MLDKQGSRPGSHHYWGFLKNVHKLDGVAPSVADPPPGNSTIDTDTHPLGYGDYMVNLIFTEADSV